VVAYIGRIIGVELAVSDESTHVRFVDADELEEMPVGTPQLLTSLGEPGLGLAPPGVSHRRHHVFQDITMPPTTYVDRRIS